jgi:hypothetical protein
MLISTQNPTDNHSENPILNSHEHEHDTSHPAFFERHVARLLLVLFHCGEPVNHMIDGETRQVDSLSRLQQFDFWVREPGHLALALMRSFSSTPERIDETKPNLREAIQRMIKDNEADIRRVTIIDTSHNILEDLDYSLSWLTARALVSDRPSFARSRHYTHQVVLETPGVAFVKKILEKCPTFAWYQAQCEIVAANFTRLEHYDLSMMTYLAPELNAAIATAAPLVPYIEQRYESLFGLSNNDTP